MRRKGGVKGGREDSKEGIWYDWQSFIGGAPWDPPTQLKCSPRDNNVISAANYTITEYNMQDSIYRGGSKHSSFPPPPPPQTDQGKVYIYDSYGAMRHYILETQVRSFSPKVKILDRNLEWAYCTHSCIYIIMP